MSRISNHKLGGYHALANWTDDPTDSSLRESELDRNEPAPPVQVSYSAPPTAIPRQVAAAAAVPSPMGSSPAGSLPHTTSRTKFRDLDDFLNSDESEEETESDEESLHAAVTAPPRRDIVPEYDEGSSDEEEYEEETEEESDEYDEYDVDEAEKTQLYRQ